MDRVTQGAVNLMKPHLLTHRSHFIGIVVLVYFSQATQRSFALDTRQKLA